MAGQHRVARPLSQTRRVPLGLTLTALACAVTVLACADETPTVIDDSVAQPCLPDGGGPGAFRALPEREGPPAATTGSVPHQQIDPEIVPEAVVELHQRVFELPDVERQPSAISVAGATGIWIRPELNIGRPECMVRGRELAHIHLDGSLHATLPHGRIDSAEEAGWVERHPWSGVRPGFEAFVMIFTPRTSEEVGVIFDLVVEGLNFVTGG